MIAYAISFINYSSRGLGLRNHNHQRFRLKKLLLRQLFLYLARRRSARWPRQASPSGDRGHSLAVDLARAFIRSPDVSGGHGKRAQ
jgi:hypothetical protein